QSGPTPPATASPPGENKVPLGSQSVLAASNGLERTVQYVPVPIVTMPEPRKPPMPPMPQIPEAPQPNNKQFVNAFSPPPMPGAARGGRAPTSSSRAARASSRLRAGGAAR